jgi:hypothetical protein
MQDTGYIPQRAGHWSGQSSAHDTENSRYNRWVQYYWTPELKFCWLCTNTQEAGFKGRPASIQISGVGSGNKNKLKVQYRVLLKRRDGHVAEFTPYGFEKITVDAVSINLEKAKRLFPSVAGSLKSPEGPVHMLVCLNHMRDAPKEQARKEGILLYQCELSTGHVAYGNMGGMAVERKVAKLESRVLSCMSTLFHPLEFIPAEAMGTELPRRCPACKNCNECRFQMNSRSFKENTKYEINLSKLKLDVGLTHQ